MSDRLKCSHLGDGVYAHDEGHAIVLAVDHHKNKVIVLEREVLLALIDYAKESKLIG